MSINQTFPQFSWIFCLNGENWEEKLSFFLSKNPTWRKLIEWKPKIALIRILWTSSLPQGHKTQEKRKTIGKIMWNVWCAEKEDAPVKKRRRRFVDKARFLLLFLLVTPFFYIKWNPPHHFTIRRAVKFLFFCFSEETFVNYKWVGFLTSQCVYLLSLELTTQKIHFFIIFVQNFNLQRTMWIKIENNS